MGKKILKLGDTEIEKILLLLKSYFLKEIKY